MRSMRNYSGKNLSVSYCLVALWCLAAYNVSHAAGRARLIVLADMGNKPDEEQQMTHLLI